MHVTQDGKTALLAFGGGCAKAGNYPVRNRYAPPNRRAAIAKSHRDPTCFIAHLSAEPWKMLR
jgi:hypothetical protein